MASSSSSKKPVVKVAKLPVVEFSVGEVKEGAELWFKQFFCDDGETSHNKRMKLVAGSSHMEYIGSNFSNDPSRQHMKQFLAIVDKKTGEKKICQADSYKLYPIVKVEDEVDSDVERQEAMKKVQEETRSFIERQDSLTDTFGSSKRKKAMATRLRNKVSDSTEAVKATVENMMLEEGFSGEAEGEQNLSILPYDKEATEPGDVYPLEMFIPRNVRTATAEASKELLKPSLEKIMQWKEKKDPLGTRYISWHATHAHPSVLNDHDVHEEYASCLQILAYLIKLHSPTGSVADKDAYVQAMSPAVKEWLVTEFTPGEKTLQLKRKVPARMKDKILSYAVVLVWHIDSCQMDVQMVAEAFGISEFKVSTVIRALGGKTIVSTQGGMKRSIGVLKMPLDFPTPSRRKSRS